MHSPKLKEEIQQIIGIYRGLALDAVELAAGQSPSWPFLRSQLLKIFGTRGIEGRILEAVTGEPMERVR